MKQFMYTATWYSAAFLWYATIVLNPCWRKLSSTAVGRGGSGLLSTYPGGGGSGGGKLRLIFDADPTIVVDEPVEWSEPYGLVRRGFRLIVREEMYMFGCRLWGWGGGLRGPRLGHI